MKIGYNEITLSESELDDILNGVADAVVGDVQPHPQYSGRGMFGAECLGVSSARLGDAILFMTELAAHAATDDAGEIGAEALFAAMAVMTKDMRTDSMGLDIVVYWPQVRVVGA